ncbi:MAG: hypothetical protein IT537_02895 [Hyphomicrobiales bacterium]|nr:hypothetical protein [Hyphomicrobiales bacterium]
MGEPVGAPDGAVARRLVRGGEVTIEVLAQGEGPRVVMLPSLRRWSGTWTNWGGRAAKKLRCYRRPCGCRDFVQFLHSARDPSYRKGLA